jgi:hypothetical protein
VGFTHSGDEAPLVNEKNNLGETKTEYNTEVNMTIRCKANEGKRKTMKKEDIPHQCTQFDLRRVAHVRFEPGVRIMQYYKQFLGSFEDHDFTRELWNWSF